jgi:hypothetical protein
MLSRLEGFDFSAALLHLSTPGGSVVLSMHRVARDLLPVAFGTKLQGTKPWVDLSLCDWPAAAIAAIHNPGRVPESATRRYVQG